MPNMSIPKVLTIKSTLSTTITAIITVISLILGVSIGSVSLPPLEVIKTVLTHITSFDFKVSAMTDNIVWLVRLPRVLIAFLVGGALASAGSAMQALLRNPLADPYTLGISSGASLGAVFVIYTGFTIPFIGAFTLPVLGIIAGFITLVLVVGFASFVSRSLSNEVIILAGIVVSAFLGALISLMVAISDEHMRQIVSWLLGSVAMKNWDHVWLVTPFILTGFILLWLNRHELNLFAAGEAEAHHLGVSVKKRKYFILIATACMTGAAVSVSGVIGFVGLIVPHAIRLVTGPNQKRLLGLSFFYGGSFLVLADLLARTVISPEELPLGVLTAIAGAPVFAALLIAAKKKGTI